ncbi:hypothetical protein [Sphingobacterium sp. LRF_L2]|uniref:hypothetical protein n=1 Tax=Sphingobacterium sp. LRF_L2 TaxID=3369421 RepID=UPI003F618C89
MNIKSLVFFIVLSSFIYEGTCQSKAVPIEEKAYSFAVDLLKEGTYQADILDTPPVSPEQQIIWQKMQASLAGNPEWVKEMLLHLALGEPFPYHENLGIDEEEYRSILTTLDSERLIKVDSTSVRIIHEDNIIRFGETENDEQSLLDYLYIDKIDRQIYIDDDALAFRTHLLVNETNSKFSNAWHGYSWEYQDVPVEKLEDLDFSEPFDATLFKCTIGKIEETDDIILYITAKIIEQGQPAVNTRLVLVLRK